MKKTKKSNLPNVIETYETEIEFMCPVRGLVKQKVTVKRFEPGAVKDSTDEILPSQSLTDQLDLKFSGLLMEDDSLEEDDDELASSDETQDLCKIIDESDLC